MVTRGDINWSDQGLWWALHGLSRFSSELSRSVFVEYDFQAVLIINKDWLRSGINKRSSMRLEKCCALFLKKKMWITVTLYPKYNSKKRESNYNFRKCSIQHLYDKLRYKYSSQIAEIIRWSGLESQYENIIHLLYSWWPVKHYVNKLSNNKFYQVGWWKQLTIYGEWQPVAFKNKYTNCSF